MLIFHLVVKALNLSQQQNQTGVLNKTAAGQTSRV